MDCGLSPCLVVSFGPSLWDWVVLSVGDSGKVGWNFVGIVGRPFVTAKLCNKQTILVPVLASVTWVRTGKLHWLDYGRVVLYNKITTTVFSSTFHVSMIYIMYHIMYIWGFSRVSLKQT